MHIPPYDNHNKPIIDVDDARVPLNYFNIAKLKAGQSFYYQVPGYETAIVPATGTVDMTVEGETFNAIGQRGVDVWDGEPEGVYAPSGSKVQFVCTSESAEVFIAGARFNGELTPFAVRAADIDKIQYGSDDTKTHRKIKHLLGQKNADRRGRLLVSELFTVGAGGWSGFPPHKHDTERGKEETEYQEVYQFRFNPDHGFGAQFVYAHEDDYGPVYHVRSGSVIAIDRGYHPSVAAPGYEMYYFTVITGAKSKSLIQHFDPHHAYQIETIPGIKNMIAGFK